MLKEVGHLPTSSVSISIPAGNFFPHDENLNDVETCEKK